jgi:hypothetical protein
MAYQREFFGDGLFQSGPAGAMFRTEVFRQLGGFVNEGAASDHLFWMRACTSVNVLLLPADLFWYRIHPSQELQSDSAQRQNAATLGALWAALADPACPLTAAEREQAKRNRAFHLAKRTLQDIRRGRWRFAIDRLLALGDDAARLAAVACGVRAATRSPARRSTPAATFVTPTWVQKT